MCVRVIVDIFLVRFLFFFASFFFLRVDVATKNKVIQEPNIMSTTRDSGLMVVALKLQRLSSSRPNHK